MRKGKIDRSDRIILRIVILTKHIID